MTYEYGLWPLVVVNAAVFIIFVFSFFRPKSKIDWRAFGGLSAFLIALFTEMYGFPLTLFLFAPWIEKYFPGTNIFTHDSGMLWNVIFNINRNDPMMSWIHTLSVIIIAIGFIIIYVAWRSLYGAQKEHKIATDGLYKYVRHPQYDGFLLIMIGYLIMWPTILTLLMFPILVFMYIRLAKKEELITQKEFGEAYQCYREKVPGFMPNFNLKKLKFFIIGAGVILLIMVTLSFSNSLFGFFVVATVNGSPMSRLSVIGELEKQSGKQVLETLIQKKLVAAELNKKGITITKEEVDLEIKKIESQIISQGGTIKDVLASQNMTENQLRERISSQKGIEKLLGDSMRVSLSEIDAYIKDNKINPPKDLKIEDFKQQIDDQIKQQKFQQEAQKWLSGLMANAKINYYFNY